MKKETKCWVVDKNGEVIVFAGDFVSLLSNVVNGPQNHVVVRYWSDVDSKVQIHKVFPIESVYFQEMEVN